MLDIKNFTPSFSVSMQISVADLSEISKMGFKSVVNNRPDGEVSEQPSSVNIKNTCNEFGLEYAYLPVVAGTINKESVREFRQLLKSLPAPVLAFCRTGTRCSILWISSSENTQDLSQRIDCAASNGYMFDQNALPVDMLRK